MSSSSNLRNPSVSCKLRCCGYWRRVALLVVIRILGNRLLHGLYPGRQQTYGSASCISRRYEVCSCPAQRTQFTSFLLSGMLWRCPLSARDSRVAGSAVGLQQTATTRSVYHSTHSLEKNKNNRSPHDHLLTCTKHQETFPRLQTAAMYFKKTAINS